MVTRLGRITTEGCNVLLEESERRALVQQTSVQVFRRDMSAGELSANVQQAPNCRPNMTHEAECIETIVATILS